MFAHLLLVAALFTAPCDAAPRGLVGRVPQRASFESAQHTLNRRLMTHVEPPACDEACGAIVETIPRGGAQKSISVKTEGGNSLVAGILHGVGKISPTLASLLKVFFKIVESLTGLDLVPVKVGEKAKKSSRSSGSKKKSSKSKKSRATVAEDESSDDEEEAEPVKAPPKKKKVAAGGGGSGGGSAAAKKHLATSLKSTSPNYRIQKELKQFLSSPPPNLKVSVGKNIRVWIVTFKMPEDTIYAGEKYRLRIQFPADYPTQPPSVYFMQPTPRHEHVYTNGDICLSLLGKDWRPTMTAQSLAVSIMSILSGARKKSLPMDNARQAMNKPGQKQDDWIYHDDNC